MQAERRQLNTAASAEHTGTLRSVGFPTAAAQLPFKWRTTALLTSKQSFALHFFQIDKKKVGRTAASQEDLLGFWPRSVLPDCALASTDTGGVLALVEPMDEVRNFRKRLFVSISNFCIDSEARRGKIESKLLCAGRLISIDPAPAPQHFQLAGLKRAPFFCFRTACRSHRSDTDLPIL